MIKIQLIRHVISTAKGRVSRKPMELRFMKKALKRRGAPVTINAGGVSVGEYM